MFSYKIGAKCPIFNKKKYIKTLPRFSYLGPATINRLLRYCMYVLLYFAFALLPTILFSATSQIFEYHDRYTSYTTPSQLHHKIFKRFVSAVSLEHRQQYINLLCLCIDVYVLSTGRISNIELKISLYGRQASKSITYAEIVTRKSCKM